ncbi:unnamed protein product [Linum tenue]|uniref:Uncharacterized protein n=1 Tax=Linum tenue TaxID=586396 RepID=A0AAV0GWI3_9ROSI|nr:unnamed protein product [Linum tenue]
MVKCRMPPHLLMLHKSTKYVTLSLVTTQIKITNVIEKLASWAGRKLIEWSLSSRSVRLLLIRPPILLQQLGPGLDGLQKLGLQPHRLPQQPNQPPFNLRPSSSFLLLRRSHPPRHRLQRTHAATARLLPQHQLRFVYAPSFHRAIEPVQARPPREFTQIPLARRHHLLRVLPRRVERDHDARFPLARDLRQRLPEVRKRDCLWR